MTEDLAQQKRLCADAITEKNVSNTRSEKREKKAKEDSKIIKQLLKAKGEL